MVTDLFTNKVCLASLAIVFPFTKEKLSQERIQRLLFASQLVASTAILLFQGCEEPLED